MQRKLLSRKTLQSLALTDPPLLQQMNSTLPGNIHFHAVSCDAMLLFYMFDKQVMHHWSGPMLSSGMLHKQGIDWMMSDLEVISM